MFGIFENGRVALDDLKTRIKLILFTVIPSLNNIETNTYSIPTPVNLHIWCFTMDLNIIKNCNVKSYTHKTGPFSKTSYNYNIHKIGSCCTLRQEFSISLYVKNWLDWPCSFKRSVLKYKMTTNLSIKKKQKRLSNELVPVYNRFPLYNHHQLHSEAKASAYWDINYSLTWLEGCNKR